ncbi:SDR family oxidoreductase [Breoghania sp.]|uniref:SDR family NAD(P)-dependent oxidoreductase n=1 Tax=Breoghania sp. TaxID=2065378 RepID=UPI00261A1E0F|nr:SDR family oxidoreductase [Breoghania sp.]MDJ0933558.1 SDR family oxidoreductase [Breoghania sp.]
MTVHPPRDRSGDTPWVVVTGASRGIGAATARALHDIGLGVILWARDRERLAALAETMEARERVRWTCVDIGCPEQVARAVETTLPRGTRLAGIVLNAGSGRWQPFTNLAFEDWRKSLETNLSGAFLTLKALLPFLDYASAPIVIGVLSDSALTAFPNRAAYSSAKSGFQALLGTFRR